MRTWPARGILHAAGSCSESSVSVAEPRLRQLAGDRAQGPGRTCAQRKPGPVGEVALGGGPEGAAGSGERARPGRASRSNRGSLPSQSSRSTRQVLLAAIGAEAGEAASDGEADHVHPRSAGRARRPRRRSAPATAGASAALPARASASTTRRAFSCPARRHPELPQAPPRPLLDHRLEQRQHPARVVAGIRWIVIRITQVRSSERSSVRARSMSASVRRRLRERKVSGPA